MSIADNLSMARMASTLRDGTTAVQFSKAVLATDPCNIEALTIYGEFASDRDERIGTLRKAYGVAKALYGEEIRKGEISAEVASAMLGLAEELAKGDEGEVIEAIGMMEELATDTDHGQTFAFHRIARWCAEIGLFSEGLPWAALSASLGNMEGLLWGALYIAPLNSSVAEGWLRQALDENPHICRLLDDEERPETVDMNGDFRSGSIEEALLIANVMQAGWRKGADRIEDILGDIMAEYDDIPATNWIT